MAYVPGINVATNAAATAAAAANRRKLRKEEQEMTPYGNDEIEGWEFKIVRAATPKFRDPEFVRQLCAEEAIAGWEMLEKFDDYRVRFKRRTSCRAEDEYLETDPYRTQVGMTGGQRELMIAGYVTGGFAVAFLIGFVIYLFVR